MRNLTLFLVLALAIIGAGCTAQSGDMPTDNKPTARVVPAGNANGAPAATPPVSVAHGGTPPATTTAPAANTGAPAAGDENTGNATADKQIAELTARIEKAAGKDKAAAYIERGNIYFNAGQPRLYKFALRDFRLAAKLQPDNAEAKGKRDQIISIYQSMGRPVPTLGEEN